MSRLSWVLRIVVAVILLQTLFFKFTGAEESIYIFTTVGRRAVGPLRVGRDGADRGGAAARSPARSRSARCSRVGVGVGAVFSHLTLLGIDVKGDGGLLFGLACVVLAGSAIVLAIHRRELPLVGPSL